MLLDRLAGDGRRALFALAGLVVVSGAPAPAQAQFAVSPVIVQLPSTPGGGSAVIQIDNEGEDDMRFRVYAMDFDQDRDGDHSFARPGSGPESCAHRLRFAPDALSVPAGGRAAIQVRLEPEAGTEPAGMTCWSMLFVEAPATEEGPVRINKRIGVKVYGLGSNSIAPEGGLYNAAARPLEAGVEVRFGFRNAGDWPVRPTGAVEIRDLEGTIVATMPVDGFSVLPRRERDVNLVVPLDGVPPGRYLAVPILDFGADFLAGAQVDFRLGD